MQTLSLASHSGWALKHQLDDGFRRVAGLAGFFQFLQIISPQRLLARSELVEVLPGKQAAVVTVIEGYFQRILARGFYLAQAYVDFPDLQNPIAVALDFGGGRVHAQKLSRQVVLLAGGVFEREGFRGFVQVDGVGDWRWSRAHWDKTFLSSHTL